MGHKRKTFVNMSKTYSFITSIMSHNLFVFLLHGFCAINDKIIDKIDDPWDICQKYDMEIKGN